MIITLKEALCRMLVILICCNLKEASCDNNDASTRNQKHFSLFSVVTFANEECSSESTFNGGAIQGTCYSATECSDKKGTKSGNCASGFGVCCVFVYSTLASTTISENRTYIQNPLYPTVEAGATSAGTTITYTINKASADICWLRLDFDSFQLAGPANTREAATANTDGNCLDTFIPTSTAPANVNPTLCGVMTGQHLYVEMGMASTDKVTLALSIASNTVTANTAGILAANVFRKWRMKTSQITCWADYRPPPGCQQYFMGTTGQIISPNFAELTVGAQGANLMNWATTTMQTDMKYCIRREKNACCVLYQVCNSFAGTAFPTPVIGGDGTALNGENGWISDGWSFHVSIFDAPTDAALTADDNDTGLTDAACTQDYVEIPDSTMGIKSYGATVENFTKYCGHRFGYIPSANEVATGINTHAPIWDCTEPFEVSFHTDNYQDNGAKAVGTAPPTIANIERGMCIDFRQDRC